MKTINKKMTINELISVDSDITGFLLELGMHCVGCPSAQAETLEEAGFVHGQDIDAFVDKVNAHLAAKEQA